MKLKIARKISDGLMLSSLAALFLQIFFPIGRAKTITTWALILLLMALGAVNLLGLRCPHCKGQLTRRDKKVCRHCGQSLEEEAPK